MNLMNLIRSIGFLAIGWTVVALGMGALGVGAPGPLATNFFVPEPSLHQVLVIGKPALSGEEQLRLVDQVTGKSEPIRLPSEDVWALLTVSPWRDRNGNLEVIGRWLRHLDAATERPFSGLGLFRLPDATVVSRVALDVVPTGRPCALPGQPGEILFPSGNGRLYRCNLADDSRADTHSRLPSEEGEEFVDNRSVRPVTWRCGQPGAGQIYMTDPVSSADPSLRDYVFVSLSTQKRLGRKILQEPHKLWWLKMNDRYDEIKAAGPLNRLVANVSTIEPVAERFPTIAADAEGALSLIYMTRKVAERSWRLHCGRLAQSPKSGEPDLLQKEKAPGPFAEGLAAEPPFIAADGKHVFATTTTGELSVIALTDGQ